MNIKSNTKRVRTVNRESNWSFLHEQKCALLYIDIMNGCATHTFPLLLKAQVIQLVKHIIATDNYVG